MFPNQKIILYNIHLIDDILNCLLIEIIELILFPELHQSLQALQSDPPIIFIIQRVENDEVL